MTPEESRAHYNFLLSLCIRKAESFGPLAFIFIKDKSSTDSDLTPEEQFNLLMALTDAFSNEPKRYGHKLDCLHKALELFSKTRFYNPEVERQLQQKIQRLKAELDFYNTALKPERHGPHPRTPHRIIVETNMPDCFLSVAQQQAADYYQQKFRLSRGARIDQHFSSQTRVFEPDHPTAHKEFPGACVPFVQARTGAWHIMLSFDLRISRSPEDPLEAGVRI